MSIAKLNPNTILLHGPSILWDADQGDAVGTFRASAAITPGWIIELHDNTNVLAWRPHGTDSEQVSTAVALDRPENNDTIDDDYSIADTVKAAWLSPGAVFFGVIPSGQDIQVGEFLQSNGDGKLKTASATTATANVAKFQSLDAPGSVIVDTRLRVVVIQ